MQLHQLSPAKKLHTPKRVGRGGKRGTFSGRGSKGQTSRAGHRIRKGFRGGDNPVWKLFPKQRGATKKTKIKRRMFQIQQNKPIVFNMRDLEKYFASGETVSKATLAEKGMIKSAKLKVKILGTGKLTKKLTFADDLIFSKSAREQIS